MFERIRERVRNTPPVRYVNEKIAKAEERNRIMKFTLDHLATSTAMYLELCKGNDVTVKSLEENGMGPHIFEPHVERGYLKLVDGKYQLTEDGEKFGLKLAKLVDIIASKR